MTVEFTLKAMAENYGDGPHHWDFLDKETCQQGYETIKALRESVKTLTAERDEADRRAGAAERRLSHLEDNARKRSMWTDEAKRARGYGVNVSFDTVWADTCQLADAGARMRTALEEIASFKEKDGDDQATKEWNRAGRYARQLAKEGLEAVQPGAKNGG